MTATVETAKTLADLAKLAELDDKTMRDIKHKTCNTIFKSVRRVFDTGNIKKHSGNVLEAYVLYMRTATLCSIIQKLSGKSEFSRTSEGKEFIEIFKRTLIEIEQLRPDVCQILDDKRLATSIVEKEREEQSKQIVSIPTNEPVLEGDYISPKEVVSYAKKGNKILILDYRSNTEYLVKIPEPNPNRNHNDEHILHENIIIAECPPFCIEASLTLGQLSKVIPIRERLKVDNMTKYDLVVFMDDDNPKRTKEGRLMTPECYLMNALTIYAHNQRLKRDPVFMKGGFKMWDYTYPMYTTKDYQESVFKDNDDEFKTMLTEYRGKNSLNIEYPNLIKPIKEPPWPSSTGQQTNQQQIHSYIKWRKTPLPDAEPMKLSESLKNVSISSPNNPFNQLEEPKRRLSPNMTNITSFSTTPDAPPVTRTTPTIDRNNKPIINHQIPPNIPPPNNGYIRTDSSSQVGFESFTSPKFEENSTNRRPEEDKKEQIVPSRPPIPDRSTKVPAMSQERQERLLQMYDHACKKLYESSTKGKQESGVGFVNMGNTCFMNTTLQALIHTPGMKELFSINNFLKLTNFGNVSGSSGVISAVFSALMDLYWSYKVKVIRPDFFLKAFAEIVNRSMADRRQHDAQEFQIYLLDALHEDTNRVERKRGFEQNYDGTDLENHAADYEKKQKQFASSPITDLFNIRTVSIIECIICNKKSATFEEMSQISLELEETSSQRLNYSLSKHFTQEVLDKDCKWNCPKCKKPQVAKRNTYIWRLPKVLIIHFKRFSQYGSYDYIKNDANVAYDIDNLSLDQFVHQDARSANNSYSLYAITNHTGSLNSGHYTSIVKKEHRWYKYDDDYVSEVSRDSISSNKAFVLFYRLSRT